MLSNYCCAQMPHFKRLRLLGHTLRQGYDVRPVYTFCTKQLKAYKRMPTTRLLTDVKRKRSVRCRALYTRFSKSDVKNIVFTDEKHFTLEIPLNRQINSRVYTVRAMKESLQLRQKDFIIMRLVVFLKMVSIKRQTHTEVNRAVETAFRGRY